MTTAPKPQHTPDSTIAFATMSDYARLTAERDRLRAVYVVLARALQDMTYGEDCRADSRFVTAPRWAHDNARNALADVGIYGARAKD